MHKMNQSCLDVVVSKDERNVTGKPSPYIWATGSYILLLS